MNIPDEAVEAAYGQVLSDDALRYATKASLRRLLDAAAPYMLAEFEKQRKYNALSAISELGSDDPDENPYRRKA